MLERLQLSDFKAFHDVKVQLRPLTFLLGPNNTGKSSIIAAIRLLAQTLDAPDPRIPLLLDGSLGDFGTYRDVVHGNHGGRPFRIRASGSNEEPLRVPRRRRLPRRGFGRSLERAVSQWSLEVEFKYRTRRRQLILREVELRDGGGHVVTATYVPDSDRHVITRLDDRVVPARYRASTADLFRMYNFVPDLLLYARAGAEESRLAEMFSDDEFRSIRYRADEVGFAVRRQLAGAEYLGSMRQPPARTYHQTGEGRARIGPTGENWAGILVLDSSRARDSSQELRAHVGKWLADAGLGAEVKLNWLSDRHYEVQIRHPVTGEVENLADVGQGNSQVLPVLVGGYRMPAGSLYMVEEPEIHLHPRAQAELGNFFAELYRSGVAVLAETHSEYLILRIQQKVAAGDIDPDAVAFYYVYAGRGGRKRVRRLTLDDQARFRQPVNGGFFPERLSEARKLARLRA